MIAAIPNSAAIAEPIAVSQRAAPMSRASNPLSAIAPCWKNSIQGVTVAPMLETISVTASGLSPPGSGLQVAIARPTAPQSGWLSSATGTKTALHSASPSVIRSQVA
jgi:hypothetical protein